MTVAQGTSTPAGAGCSLEVALERMRMGQHRTLETAVLKTVAAAIRAPTTTGDALVDYLADRRVLLVGVGSVGSAVARAARSNAGSRTKTIVPAGASISSPSTVKSACPVMTAKTGVNAYYIWYGDWAATGGQQILVDFAGSIGVGAARSVFTSMTTVLFEANARSSAGFATLNPM